MLNGLGPALAYSPNADCRWDEDAEEYGFDGWKELLVGLAEEGGVGSPELVEGVLTPFDEAVTLGDFESFS